MEWTYDSTNYSQDSSTKIPYWTKSNFISYRFFHKQIPLYVDFSFTKDVMHKYLPTSKGVVLVYIW